jgi:hypothetical protein
VQFGSRRFVVRSLSAFFCNFRAGGRAPWSILGRDLPFLLEFPAAPDQRQALTATQVRRRKAAADALFFSHLLTTPERQALESCRMGA